ncbi:hypothetical protein PDJAM_G00074050 [Pangasius djambal]|uniref:Uncharacterized protein n=1 Tax=Pangasius djambal TaxID=1691987 RepID=A0ACC5Z1H1_9TELE|nr:hypothetical protein [Pangasius djambal]
MELIQRADSKSRLCSERYITNPNTLYPLQHRQLTHSLPHTEQRSCRSVQKWLTERVPGRAGSDAGSAITVN